MRWSSRRRMQLRDASLHKSEDVPYDTRVLNLLHVGANHEQIKKCETNGVRPASQRGALLIYDAPGITRASYLDR